MTSLKQRFESNAVIFCATLAIAGFASGFGARGYVWPAAHDAPISCTINGLGSLETSHAQRLATLERGLIGLEDKASDQFTISAYQDVYKESADRIRKDIAAENASFQKAIGTLSANCKGA